MKQITRQSLALLLALALTVSLLGGAGALADSAETGSVQPDDSWFDGSGKYEISTAGQMVALANMVNGGYTFSGEKIILTEDIDLTGIDWVPIGGDAEKVPLDDEISDQDTLTQVTKKYGIIYDEEGNSYSGSTGEYSQEGSGDLPYDENASYYYVKSRLFSGTFDGDEKKISGLNVRTDLGYAGLFGNVNGTLENFEVSGTVIYTGSNGDYIGGVAGMLSEGGTISNVTSKVTVNAGSGWNVGGIAGFVGTPLSDTSAENTVVTMCVNEGAVVGYNKVGGVVGENAGMISLCVNTAAVNGVNGSSKNGVGGIVGRNGNNAAAIETGTVINCCNTGSINYIVTSGPKWSGGIAGFNNAKSSVINCYSTTCPRFTAGHGYSNPIIGGNEAYLGTGVVENNYALNYTGISYSGTSVREVGILLTKGELRAAACDLGGAYRTDPDGGYPKLLWTLPSSTVAFSVTDADEYTVTVTDSLGVTVAPESDGSYRLVNGETYAYTVTAPGYGKVVESLTVTANETISVALKETAGYKVTLNNMAAAAGAEITGLTSGDTYSSVTFTVSCDLACVAAVTADGGETYTRLTASANENGGYNFAIDELTGDVEVVVALKGDADGNGAITITDYTAIARALLQPGNSRYAALSPLRTLTGDADGNGTITITDYTTIARALLQPGNSRYTAIAW